MSAVLGLAGLCDTMSLGKKDVRSFERIYTGYREGVLWCPEWTDFWRCEAGVGREVSSQI